MWLSCIYDKPLYNYIVRLFCKKVWTLIFLAKVGESCQNMPQIPAHCPKKAENAIKVGEN